MLCITNRRRKRCNAMPVGDFYKRDATTGADFEVVLLQSDEQDFCKRELRALCIEVRDDATIGHFTIHLDDPLDWAKVGAVVFGEVFPETARPAEQGASTT